MKSDRKPLGGLGRRIGAALARFRRDRRANVAIIFALALVPMMGVFGLAGEGSYWMLTQRGEQNAADAAVMAAASAGATDAALADQSEGCSLCYQYEGQGVAKNYGFVTGANNVTVSVQQNQPCPSTASSTVTGAMGSSICYKVTITKIVPLYFSPVIGFNGDTTLNGAHAQQITAISYAGPKDEPVDACVLALQTTGTGILLNGAPRADLGDCTIFSDGGATCTGHNSGAFIGGAVGTDNGCGISEYSNATAIADPYASLASNIPNNSCSKYQQESPASGSGNSKGETTIPAGSYTASGLVSAINTAAGSGFAFTSTDSSGDSVAEVCGDVKLGGNVTLTSGNAVIVTENGQFDLNASQLVTSGTAGMTTVFQNQGATTSNSSTPWFTDATNGSDSAINIAAPTSGDWSGVTIYDPAATGSYTYAGNAPAWSLTGIVYFPNANITWKGVIGKSTSGYECFDLVVNTLTIKGTAQMFNPNLATPIAQCGQAGVSLPKTSIGYREVLVE